MSVPGSPSPEVARLASRENFGRLEHTFPPRKEVDVQEKYRGLFIAGSLAAVACLATGGILLVVYVHWGFALYPLFGAVLGGGALFKSPNFRKRLGSRRLHLFERGLLVDLGAGRLFAVPWDQAVHYQETVMEVAYYNGTSHPTGKSAHTSTLVASGGAKVEISDFFADFGTWVPLITEAIGRAQAQKAWEAVLEGRKVTYGPFELDTIGITAKRKGTLPWPMVETIDVQGGYVIVRQYGRRKAWAHPKVKTVPNLLVFLTVAANLWGR
jgi:hypothetical protein